MHHLAGRAHRMSCAAIAMLLTAGMGGCGQKKAAACPECEAYVDAVTTLERTCLSTQSAEVSAKLSGNLDVLKKAATGDASVSAEQIRGARRDWDATIGREENRDIRDCLKPVQEKLLSCIDSCVAAKHAGLSGTDTNAAHAVTIDFHMQGASTDCPSLPDSTQVQVVSPAGGYPLLNLTDGCRANLTVPSSATGVVQLKLLAAGPYRLSKPDEEYQLATSNWQIEISNTASSHLLLSLFTYAGLCPDIGQSFEMFQSILRSKVQSLRGLFPSSDPRYDYLVNLNVVRTGRALSGSTADVHTYWQDNGSLQVLAGLCIPGSTGEVMRSSIFSGPLAGPLPEPLVADLRVRPEEFGATRDIYTAAMLYALAREAESRHLDQDMVIGYLGRARQVAAQIRADAGGILVAAVDQALQDAGAPSGLTH